MTTRQAYQRRITVENPGIVVIKWGATWCKPCQRIAPLVHAWFAEAPANVRCYEMDVDDDFDVFAWLKSRRVVQGVPTLLCYEQTADESAWVPCDSVSGADMEQVQAFFQRCRDRCLSLQK